MKLLICGSRTITDYDLLIEAIEESGFEPTSLISGGAKGVDKLAEQYAEETGLPIEIFRPDYQRFGRGAPLVRDRQMVDAASHILACWNSISRGTRYTFEYARKKNKSVYVKTIE